MMIVRMILMVLELIMCMMRMEMTMIVMVIQVCMCMCIMVCMTVSHTTVIVYIDVYFGMRNGFMIVVCIIIFRVSSW